MRMGVFWARQLLLDSRLEMKKSSMCIQYEYRD